MRSLDELLKESSSVHGHLCAGQVLGVRMAMAGCREVGIDEPKGCKKLIVYVEIDRCATDAIQAVTGCSLGKRTLKFLDYGKMAATFINIQSQQAVRVIARDDARDHVVSYVATDSLNRREAEKIAYGVMPEELLFRFQPVRIQIDAQDMPGARGSRVPCGECGEGINFKREVTIDGKALCIPCAQSRRGEVETAEPRVVHVVGPKNSGKTTLIEKIIPQLSARGYRVATVKHHHARDPIELDWQGKDSWRHRKAGAKAVAIVSPCETALFKELDAPPSLADTIANLSGVDLVLVEGFRSGARFEIRLVAEPRGIEPAIESGTGLLALVGAPAPLDGIPALDRNDIESLVDLIEQRVLGGVNNPQGRGPLTASGDACAAVVMHTANDPN
ncbi:MAG TPA: molybdopterin-guanine dinucleotide biosynthesis protein B [Candidatus Acidoferrales bacterium]|nr:molybdopterin-guanine dinucleotide biosynthesis protein B [Candidatus Acidoferrales bacterium]